MDRFKGLKVTAKVPIRKGSLINSLLGVTIKLRDEEYAQLKKDQADFSVMDSCKSGAKLLFLGTAAFVNHSCKPNCAYESVSNHSVTIKSIKDINKGEELFCYYGDNYFGEDNCKCECETCEEANKRLLENCAPGNFF